MNRALAAMQRHVPPGSTVADLHAGVGTIGLSLAATTQPRWVRFVEISGQGRPPFQRSATRLQQQQQQELAASNLQADSGASNCSGSGAPMGGATASLAASAAAVAELEYHVAAAGSDPARWCEGAEVVVLDPPRKGLEPSLLAWLCGPAAAAGWADAAGARAEGASAGGGSVRRLLYLSCGFPALRRDATALLGSGRWRLTHAEAFLFFPGADHIETLCVFDAAPGQ